MGAIVEREVPAQARRGDDAEAVLGGSELESPLRYLPTEVRIQAASGGLHVHLTPYPRSALHYPVLLSVQGVFADGVYHSPPARCKKLSVGQILRATRA
jgi:hypothetical protein